MEDGQPWAVDRLIERMRAEVGWAPSRPKTMATFYRFWKAYGIEPPDLNPPMAGTGGDTPAVPAAYLERIDALLVTVGQLIEQNAALMQAFGLGPPPPDVQTAIEEASEQRRSASTLRPADPAPRKAPRSQVRSEG